MNIKRLINGELHEFTLTNDEIAQAHKEFVLAFMAGEMNSCLDYPMSDKDCMTLAESAYDFYCKGDGDTEYECIEKVADDINDMRRYISDYWSGGEHLCRSEAACYLGYSVDDMSDEEIDDEVSMVQRSYYEYGPASLDELNDKYNFIKESR